MRFIQEDQIVQNVQSVNLYNYVGNNPARFSDPLGLFRVNPGNDDRINPKTEPTPTIVCDGEGGFEVFLPQDFFDNKDVKCKIPRCFRRHEQSHIEDIYFKNDGRICKDKPRYTKVYYSYGEQRWSEGKAWETTLKCLQGRRRNEKDCECKKVLDRWIKIAQDRINFFK